MATAIVAVVVGLVVAQLALPTHCPGTTSMIGCAEYAKWGDVAATDAPWVYGGVAGFVTLLLGFLVKSWRPGPA